MSNSENENLENKDFEKPEDIVTATVCSKSGLLPIAGVCAGTLTTEYFAKGSVPTDTCNVHYHYLLELDSLILSKSYLKNAKEMFEIC